MKVFLKCVVEFIFLSALVYIAISALSYKMVMSPKTASTTILTIISMVVVQIRCSLLFFGYKFLEI
jgi:hypothetical protein